MSADALAELYNAEMLSLLDKHCPVMLTAGRVADAPVSMSGASGVHVQSTTE